MPKPQAHESAEVDVAIVGGGAAGVGVGAALKRAGVGSLAILERHRVGASFRNWPAEMNFITPSFTSNPFGQVDLNAVHPDTSPAFFLGREHPCGADYARYLAAVARFFELPVHERVAVQKVVPTRGGFELVTRKDPIRARFLVWAAGEFQYPRSASFPGAVYGLHNSRIKSWKSVEGDPVVVVGGFESGIDAAYHLAERGRKVVVVDPAAPWRDGGESDPSLTLSPYTRERLGRLKQVGSSAADDRMRFIAEPVLRIDAEEGEYVVKTARRTIRTPARPILATGFEGSLARIRELFEWDPEGGFPVLTAAADESTRTPGLFVCGPMVRHRTPKGLAILCFIYKFRMRFALVAAAVAQRLGHDPTPMLEAYAGANMILNDVASCCGPACAC